MSGIENDIELGEFVVAMALVLFTCLAAWMWSKRDACQSLYAKAWLRHLSRMKNEEEKGDLYRAWWSEQRKKPPQRVPCFLVRRGDICTLEGRNPWDMIEWRNPKFLTWAVLADFWEDLAAKEQEAPKGEGGMISEATISKFWKEIGNYFDEILEDPENKIKPVTAEYMIGLLTDAKETIDKLEAENSRLEAENKTLKGTP